MQPDPRALGAQLAKAMLAADPPLRQAGPKITPDLAEEFEGFLDGDDAKVWVFSGRELGLPGRTLTVNRYPWHDVQARLLDSATETDHAEISAGIAELRAIRF